MQWMLIGAERSSPTRISGIEDRLRIDEARGETAATLAAQDANLRDELARLMGEQAAMKKQSRRKRNRHHDKRKFPHQQKRKVARSRDQT